MKKYYSLYELSCLFNISIADLLHSCLMNSSNSAYISIDSKDISYLRKTGVFLKIPDENIQHMEISCLNFGKIFRVEISFLFIINEKEKNWPQFLNSDEKDLIDYVPAEKIKEFESFHEDMPWSYKTKTPIERVRSSITKKIEKVVTPSQIFMKSDSCLVTSLFKKAANSQIPPHLDPNDPTCTERMRLFYNIIKRLGDADIKAHKTHISAIAAIVEENGYDYKKGDKLVQDYAYVTALVKDNEKNPLKKIKINSGKKSISIKEV